MIMASEVLVSLMVILFQHRLCHACRDKSTGMSGMYVIIKIIAVNCSIHEAALADAS
jgi:hypothetical protein